MAEEVSDQVREVATEIIHEEIQTISAHRGPLPSPEQLIAYDQALPGTAAKIIESWQSETSHRHGSIDRRQDLEATVINSQITRDRAKESYACRGQWMALLLMLIGFGLAATIFGMHPTGAGATVASVFVGLPICAVVTTFITGRKSTPQIADRTGIVPTEEENPGT